ncbi:MAG TPA: hypothetical protein PKZ84_06145 [Anaerolineae bacterium]|nr:hypothetical protein [Anaerolineae bacterium]HQI84034.1 hypothetical protein [Anaerolineae bacterium]
MVTRSVVQSAVHTAATALVHLPPEEWAGWVVYLCETLEEATTSPESGFDVELVLQEVVDRIQERLARGNWS